MGEPLEPNTPASLRATEARAVRLQALQDALAHGVKARDLISAWVDDMIRERDALIEESTRCATPKP